MHALWHVGVFFCCFTAGVGAAVAELPALCPLPVKVEEREGFFTIDERTVVAFEPQAKGGASVAGHLAWMWRNVTASGKPLPVIQAENGKPPVAGTILLSAAPQGDPLPAEGYRLQVTPDLVRLTSSDRAGFFYAFQTLRQLLRPYAGGLPCVEIYDAPRFSWRGIMLDESRHFMGKAAVRKILDSMATLKLNRFHWHLTDAPGWRIEIKRFPELTSVGAVGDHTNPDRPAQFYTQEEIREIVAFARSREIMVIPEIELPAHSTAVMRAYPHLSCTGKPEFMYCAGKDEVLRFLEQVFDEVLGLFDAPFIHIGGDECPKGNWEKCPKCQARKAAHGLKDEHELQSWMVRHFDRYLTAKGRRLLGWDEILEGGLAPGATVMSWREIQGGQQAAAMGHDTVMTPRYHLYLDIPQSILADGFNYNRARVNNCERILDFNPVEGIAPEHQKHVLGLQGCLWGESCRLGPEAEWKLFPRAAAIAERAWSPDAKVTWPAFRRRAPEISARLRDLGLHVAPVEDPPWFRTVAFWRSAPEQWTVRNWPANAAMNESGTYIARFLFLRGNQPLRIRNVVLLEGGKEIARDSRNGFAGVTRHGPGSGFDYRLAVPEFKTNAVYTLRAELCRGERGTQSQGTVCLFPARLEEAGGKQGAVGTRDE